MMREARATKKAKQLAFRLAAPPRHGGKRPGAGRPRKHPRIDGRRGPEVPHLRRAPIDRHRPAHVTLRLLRVARSLRNGKLFQEVHGAFLASREQFGFRLVHFSVQHDHIHLIVEAGDRRALSRGMQGLSIRLARAINRRLGRSGRVLADRFHSQVLASPREVRNALAYVLGNARHHLPAGDKRLARAWIDPYSSGEQFDGWRDRPEPSPFDRCWPPCTVPPRSFLLATGWRRHGLLSPAAVPGQAGLPGTSRTGPVQAR